MNQKTLLLFKKPKKNPLVINTLKPIPNYRATTPFCVYNYLTPPIFGLTYPYWNINQWWSTKDCIKWFEEYDKNDRCSFIKYDIREFYPSITERTLDRALDLAKEYMVIPLDKVEIIKHCRKTLLYYEDSIWIKKREGGNFDTSIGAYDGAEICELMGCVLLYSINKIMDHSSHGLYRYDWFDYCG